MTRLDNLKAAIFDLDGTLLDSLGVWARVDRQFFANHGLEMQDDYQSTIKNMHFPEAARYTVETYGIPITPEAVMEEWMTLAKELYTNDVYLKPYTKEYLLSLSKKGVKLGIATSSRRELYTPALERGGVLPLFSAFVHTEEVPRGKGFPDPYLETARRLNVSPADSVVFEDIVLGIKGAKSGGFFTVGVYDPFSDNDETALKREAHFFIRSFSELL